jgi:hypothetical protein
MRFGGAEWTHLVQHHFETGPRKLPSGLASGQSAADDVNGVIHGDCRL